MANDVDDGGTIEALDDLLEALTWCGLRIAQGLQGVSSASGGRAVGPTMSDFAAEPPRSP